MRHPVAKGLVRGSRLLVPFLLAGSLCVCAQTSDNGAAPSAESQAPFQLKVTSNLVVVRVVVRDAQNKPVENLKREDFELFDRGKTQTITQFAADTAASLPSYPSAGSAPAAAPARVLALTAMPERFLALYFDDLNISNGDAIRVRDAAEQYLATHLQPTDRVAIFTSGQRLADFTNDPKEIHDALAKLHASPLNPKLEMQQECPDLSDLQAQQIVDSEGNLNIDAWKIAIDQAQNDQKCLRVPIGPGEPQRYIAALAQRVMDRFQVQVRANLQALDEVVKYTAQKPGQRVVLLVSPGFLSQSEQAQVESTIDRALRLQVVISSLDPKGLTNVTREGDVSHVYLPGAFGGLGATQGLDTEREAAAVQILAEVAQGTGGQFVHRTNDLQAGFGVLAGSPGYYLGFAPTDLKQDGRFHNLKVTLTEKHKGFTIQARRGYFAPLKGSEVVADGNLNAAPEPDAQAQEQIREVVLSRTELQQLPVTLDVKVFATKTDARGLALSAHLDTTSLRFDRQGQRNMNDIIFVAAIFDESDKLLQLQRGHVKIDAADADLGQTVRAGVKLNSIFELKPGIYRVREVVTDSEEHRITALSRTVNLSTDCCVPRPSTSEMASTGPAVEPRSSAHSDIPIANPGPKPTPNPIANPATSASGPTYLSDSTKKLTSAVPELVGMKFEAGQDQLAGILSKAGAATLHSLSVVPNLSSREDVYTSAVSRSASPANSVLGMEEIPKTVNLEEQLRQSRSLEFNYLLLFDHHPDGSTAIRELRTDFKNRQVGPSPKGPHGFGFAYQWLLLSPANQFELQFRYLGRQRIDDHATFVLAFAQVPGQVKEPGEFEWAGKMIPFFYQGIVWIDQSTFQVVRLRTDLLSPIPSVGLRRLTTELHFRSVHIHGFGAVLWLPSDVLISTAQSDTALVELHDYSAYKFFHAESKLLP